MKTKIYFFKTHSLYIQIQKRCARIQVDFFNQIGDIDWFLCPASKRELQEKFVWHFQGSPKIGDCPKKIGVFT
jgi:hypothetical protein